MLNKEEAAKFFGKLTKDQEKALESAAAGGMSEKELFARLGADEKPLRSISAFTHER